jgi:hypothetical protein
MPKRLLEVGYTYLDLGIDNYPERRTHRDLATQAKTSESNARRVIIELENTGSLTDPEATNLEKKCNKEKRYYLDPTEELFMVALRSEKSGHPNHDYCIQLALYYGTSVLTSFIPDWFKTRFNHKGSFHKLNLVPLDKFCQENVIWFVEYKLKCAFLTDKSCFCFIGKKHLVNSDTVPNDVRCFPISGRMDFIAVSGNFRDTYNMIACISSNPRNPTHTVYTIGEYYDTATVFVSFCQMMVQTHWLIHNEILVLDKMGIRTRRESADLEEFFVR